MAMVRFPYEMKRKELGYFGQNLAERFLRAKGFDVLACNYNTRGAEVDLIALDGDELVGVEVKTRRGVAFGEEEETISPRQLRRVARALSVFRHTFALRTRRATTDALRIDCVLLTLGEDYSLQTIDHLENIDYE